jgi:hypothetical protein
MIDRELEGSLTEKKVHHGTGKDGQCVYTFFTVQ